MLNGGTLEGATITVTSDFVEAPAAASATAPASVGEKEGEHHEVEQEDKPHVAKLAELLASGYSIGDVAVKKAIDADHR